MDEVTTRQGMLDRQGVDTGPDWGRLGVLLLLALGLHAWLIWHTEVTARDGIGFIRYTVQLKEYPWVEVIRSSEQHPLYPLTILPVSIVVRQFSTAPLTEVMALSAQIASGLAGVLLIFPTYFLGRELFGRRRVGFWSAAVLQCLPVCLQVTSDALSEALFLLLLASAMLFGARSLRTGSARQMAMAGLFGGLAYLTRPEGAVLVLVTLLVLVATQMARAWRRPWPAFLRLVACLLGPALVIGSPFVAIVGHITSKPTPTQMLDGLSAIDEARPHHSGPGGPIWAIWWHDPGDGSRPNPWWALRALQEEFLKSTNFWAAVLALVGLAVFRDRFRVVPGTWLVLAVGFCHGLLLWWLAYRMGYLSERHTLPLVLCSSFWAVASGLALTDFLAGLLVHWLPAIRKGCGPAAVAGVLMATLTVVGMPSALKPLHCNRAGHRSAGAWLAAHARPGDIIIDPFSWAHYYAGWVFREGQDGDVPPHYEPHYFAVVEQSANPHERLPLLPLARRLAGEGKLVFACPLKSRGGRGEQLQVYEVAPAPPPPPRPRPPRRRPAATAAN